MTDRLQDAIALSDRSAAAWEEVHDADDQLLIAKQEVDRLEKLRKDKLRKALALSQEFMNAADAQMEGAA